jgi:pumilio family protein 6
MQSAANEVIENLAGPLLMRMVHTKDGIRVALFVVDRSSARQRKKLIKGMKGLVTRACREEHGHVLIMRVLDVTDDTALLRKAVMSEIEKELADLIKDR